MYMEYHGVEIDDMEYFSISNALIELKEKVCNYYKIKMCDLRWYNIQLYLQDTHKVIFTRVNVSEKFNGKTTMRDGVILITLNQNNELNSGRKHFTAMHEISHAVLHMNEITPHQDLYYSGETSHDLKEIEADIGASELAMNDDAILQACQNGLSFYEMSNDFDVSHGALYTRLVNYLVFTMELNSQVARQILNRFRYAKRPFVIWYISESDNIINQYKSTAGAIENTAESFCDFSDFIKNNYPEFYSELVPGVFTAMFQKAAAW